MARTLEMRHLMLQLLSDDVPRASLALAELGVFVPDAEPDLAEHLPEVPGEDYRRRYRQARAWLDKIEGFLDLHPQICCHRVELVDADQLEDLGDELAVLWERCSDLEEDLRVANEELKEIQQLQALLASFASLQVDLGALQRDGHFLATRVGTLPRGNLKRLEESVHLAGHFLHRFDEHGDQAHVVVFGAKEEGESAIDSLLETAGFRELEIPEELHGQPDKVQQDLKSRHAEVQRRLEELNKDRADVTAAEVDALLEAEHILALAQPFSELGDAARQQGRLAIMTGWVPRRDLPRLQELLDERLQHAFRLDARKPRPDERSRVPTVQRPRPLLSPFTTLVQQYGVPRYGELDPSFLFAITFVLMFGMMFGDIGHGLLIAGAAIYFRKTLKRFTLFGVLVGLSSTLFGFVYGSIFGYEHVLHPWWMSPMEDPILMLQVALVWGVAFITLATIMSVRNALAERDWAGAFFGGHGLASLALYLSMVWLGYAKVDGQSLLAPLVLLILALLSTIVHEWHELDAPLGERLLVVLVEGFERIMGNFSSTLSFLRVAAFGLNHVALAVAVFALADMMDGASHWVMVVFGNIFILVVEGMIVTIQVLRLEFYEGFSRFYIGDGRPFKPLNLPGFSKGPIESQTIESQTGRSTT